ncbi:MAG: glycogen synthase [Desulfobacterales bacterium]
MKIAMLTREYPPHIYGGAGVHVDNLTRELSRLDNRAHEFHVWCFGEQDGVEKNIRIRGIQQQPQMGNGIYNHPVIVDALTRNTVMADTVQQADLVHCHTWYTHFAGCLLKELLSVPLVITTHSLEPHRPWKEEQLKRGYSAASWLEKTAYENADGVIAVSAAMKQDVQALYHVPENRIQVIPNGIDENRFKSTRHPERVRAYGINPNQPFILMVARITRQKGIFHFLRAARHLKSDVQVVLCASSPDTPELMSDVSDSVSRTEMKNGNPIIWIKESVPVDDLIVLYSHADVFVCPSVYEPFGITLLEAMACGLPVVASAVGGIPSVVANGKTGRLVSFETAGDNGFEPSDPGRFARDLAEQIDELLNSPVLLSQMGVAARQRVMKYFTWKSIAEKTFIFYSRLIEA